MKLADYLETKSIKRKDFAAQIGVSPATVTGWCEGTFGISKKRSKEVFDATGGAVTPNDFADFVEAEAGAE